MTDTGNDWAELIAQAVHDQRGLLSNVVVILTLLERHANSVGDDRLTDFVKRIDSSIHSMTDICKTLHDYTEITQGFDATRTARDIEDLLGSGEWVVEDDNLRVATVDRDRDRFSSTLVDMANALSRNDEPPRLSVVAEEGFAVMRARSADPRGCDPEALFDGQWKGIEGSNPRGLPLKVYVARLAAEQLGGRFDARMEEGDLVLEVALPLM